MSSAVSPVVAEETEFTIGPDYADAPETKALDGVPKGKIEEFTMDSKDSRIYQGIAKNQPGTVPYQRKVAVYIPAGHRPNNEMPFIVVQDGMGYRDVFAKNVGHTDRKVTRQTLPAALEWLWQGYVAQ